MKQILVGGLVILLLVLVTACSRSMVETDPTNDNFDVLFFARLNAADVVTVLDVRYTVENNTVVACDGIYIVQTALGGEATKCDVQKLVNKEYAVPIQLIRDASLYNTTGSIVDGPGEVRWEIVR